MADTTTQVQGINISNFMARMESGNITLTKIAKDSFSLVCKRFDPTTGEEVEPQFAVFRPEQVLSQRRHYEDQIKAIEGQIERLQNIIADIDVLLSVMKENGGEEVE